MSQSAELIFVLWGNGFDETTATIFITELRRAGLQVKLVSLTQRRSNGTYGLALVPDLTLEQILPLADRTRCMIVPYTSTGNKRLRNDPRLSEFFERAHANQARFVIGPLDQADLAMFPPDIDKVIVEPGSEALIKVARELARSLAR
jgi:putative intracellular protease/amidase